MNGVQVWNTSLRNSSGDVPFDNASLTFSYDDSLIEAADLSVEDFEQRLGIFGWNESSQAWQPFETLGRDLDANKISIDADELTLFLLGIVDVNDNSRTTTTLDSGFSKTELVTLSGTQFESPNLSGSLVGTTSGGGGQIVDDIDDRNELLTLVLHEVSRDLDENQANPADELIDAGSPTGIPYRTDKESDESDGMEAAIDLFDAVLADWSDELG